MNWERDLPSFLLSTKAKMRILVIEDNVQDQKFLNQILSRFADEIYFIDGQKDVFKWIEKVDLVILDLNLGLVHGKHLLKKIKRRKKVLPIIVYTTSNNPDDVKECYSLGANCYVVKPFGLVETLEKLEKLGEFWKGVSYTYGTNS